MEHELAAPLDDGTNRPMRNSLVRPAAVAVDPSLPLHQGHPHAHLTPAHIHAHGHPHPHQQQQLQHQHTLSPHPHPHPLSPPHHHHHLQQQQQQQQQQSTHDHLNQYLHLTDPALLGAPQTSATDYPIDPALHAVDPSLTAPVTYHQDLSQAAYPLQHAHHPIQPHHSSHQPLELQQPQHLPHQPEQLQQQPLLQQQQQQQQQQQPQQAPAVGHEIEQALEPVMPGGGDTKAGISGPTVKRNPAAFEDNDQELRRLAAENAGVPLRELASRVREDENGPKAERARQILGMAWLNFSCEQAADTSVAVPRNRVYARYVSMCASERIKPLNPASFGKLVRINFPEIKTRRLGVRGHSKYHYCGIKLRGDPSVPNSKANTGPASSSEPPPPRTVEDHLHVGRNGSKTPEDFYTLAINGHASNSPSHFYFNLSPVAKFLQQDLFFPSPVSYECHLEQTDAPSEPIKLPELMSYAPSNVDHDTISSLEVIYLSHCTSLLECVRFMRLRQFFKLFASFQGTLTSPVQKLFADPAVAPWIRAADWATYKRIIEILSPLARQAIPGAVLHRLRTLSDQLTPHITQSFSQQPPHVIEAKTGPSNIFSTVLDRLLRVNQAAHAAALVLQHKSTRAKMRMDWKNHVNCKRIVEHEVPCRTAAVQRILEDEILSFLPEESESRASSPVADDDHYSHGMEPIKAEPIQMDPIQEEPSPTSESLLDPWHMFILSLPQRFSNIPPRTLLVIFGAVASAALRDMTFNGSETLRYWWIIRLYMDEWLAWNAELGGFLRHGETSKSMAVQPSRPLSRQSICSQDIDDEMDMAPDEEGNCSEYEHGPDDSGISIREELFSNNEDPDKLGMGG